MLQKNDLYLPYYCISVDSSDNYDYNQVFAYMALHSVVMLVYKYFFQQESLIYQNYEFLQQQK